MSNIKLIAQVSLLEAIERDSEGLDKKLLFQALQVRDFTDPVDGATLLLQLEAKYQVKVGSDFPIDKANVVQFRRCELFERTYAKHKKAIGTKFNEFIDFKTKFPMDRFGKKDQHFTAGPISDTKVIHCHLNGDISLLYRSGRNPMFFDLVMVGTHDELGTGQPGNTKVQKQVVKAMAGQVFEGKKPAEPRKGEVLASYTDAEGYKSEIVWGVPPGEEGKLAAHFPGSYQRAGVMYIVSPEGEREQSLWWMNSPEEEWGISDEEWASMPYKDRAKLEVKQQATAYDSLSKQFESRKRLNARRKK